MSEQGSTTVIFKTESVQIHAYGCHGGEFGPPREASAPFSALLLVRHGMFVKTVRGRPLVADPNTAHFFNRGDEYIIASPGPDGDKITEIEIAPSLLAEIAEANNPQVVDPVSLPFEQTHVMLDSAASFLQHYIWRIARKQIAIDALALEEASLLIVSHLLKKSLGCLKRDKKNRPATAKAHRDLAHHTKLILSTQCCEHLTLDTIARRVNSSPYHLSRVFRNETGIPMHRYLNRLRLRSSLDGLASNDVDLAGYSLDLGFASQSHFTTAFGREFGISPSQCRSKCSQVNLRQMSKNLKDN